MTTFKWYPIPNTDYKISSLGSLMKGNEIIKGNYNRGKRTYKLKIREDDSTMVYFAEDLLKYALGKSNILHADDKRKQPKTTEHKEKISKAMKGKGFKYLCYGIEYSSKEEAAKALNVHYQTIWYRCKKELKGFKLIK